MLAGWALANAHSGSERFGVARGGVAAGLMFAFGYALFRLRPRAGWGVTVTPTALAVARPFSEDEVRLSWPQISMARSEGPRGSALLVFTKAGDRLLIPRHLFGSTAQFAAMSQAIQAHVEPLRLDA